jgi:hypothetical protein
MAPLAAATRAEAAKHKLYECAKHGWELVPLALESYGAKGVEARRLLQRMAAHALERTPEEFLRHAECVLSVALQRAYVCRRYCGDAPAGVSAL